MKFNIYALVIYGIAQGTNAWPSPSLKDAVQSVDPRALDSKHKFIAPQPGWKRSPCPGTNTMANHGFINRDGKNITKHAFMKGFRDMFNLAFTETQVGSNQAMRICASILGLPDKECTTEMSLDMLDKHNAVEHDASLSRNDKFRIDNPDADVSPFNMTIWNKTMDIIGEETTHVNMRIANTMRLRRVEQSRDQEDIPGMWEENVSASIKENAFLLALFNDPKKGKDYLVDPLARKDWIHYFFVNEQLPTDLGWAKATATITNVMSLAHALETKSTIPATPARQTNAPASKFT